MRTHALYQLTLCKLREMLREPEMVFWIFVFPLLLAGALAIAFRAQDPDPLPVGVVMGAPAAERSLAALQADPRLAARPLAAEESRASLRRGEVLLVVVPEAPPVYRYDPGRPDSELARLLADAALQRAAGRADVFEAATRELEERGSRYIDFLVPGLLGMNLMGTGMWGIGFFIVSARQKKLLKRLVATPMRRSDFMLAQAGGRLVFLALEVGMLLAFASWALGVPQRGSLVTLILVAVVGASTFSALGLLVASRAQTTEGVSGLMNAAMMPMWVLSGIFFSTSRFPDAMQPVVQALPLTAVNDALRAVMLEGAGLAAVAGEIVIAAVWGVAAFALALGIFRWQ